MGAAAAALCSSSTRDREGRAAEGHPWEGVLCWACSPEGKRKKRHGELAARGVHGERAAAASASRHGWSSDGGGRSWLEMRCRYWRPWELGARLPVRWLLRREEEEARKLWRLEFFEGWECKITKCKERGLLFIEEALGLGFP
jgi:hypothetical protein